MFKIVLDTNVLVSALLKDQSIPAFILSLILQERGTLCVSKDIFTEYKGVLAGKKFRQLNQTKVQQLLTILEKQALWVAPQRRFYVIKVDPEDNKFLECAFISRADVLVTGNIKHFSMKKFYRTMILTPRGFLELAARTMSK